MSNSVSSVKCSYVPNYEMSSFNDLNTSGETQYTISSFDNLNKLKCFTICTKNVQCSYLLFNKDQNKCLICNHNVLNYLIFNPSSQNMIYKKNRTNPYFIRTKGLINYWPFYENAKDVIGTSHLTNGVNVSLTSDRNSISLSAMSFNTGYMKAPSGYYFGNANFTVMVWVKVRTVTTWDKIIDFGSGSSTSNVICAFSGGKIRVPRMVFLVDAAWKSAIDYSEQIELNKWIHLSFVFAYPNGFVYLNGVENSTLASSFYTAYPKYTLRTNNLVGASNWPNDGNIDADMDELKIFNRDLNQEEILNEMDNNFYF